MTTTDEKVPNLIKFINRQTNLNYDYPVPDVIVEPVQAGNSEFLAWVKKSVTGEENPDALDPEEGTA